MKLDGELWAMRRACRMKLPPREAMVLAAGKAADFQPVFFAGVFVDVDRAAVEPIATAPFGAGNPEFRAGCDIEIVGFEGAAVEGLKGAALVIDGFAGLGELDAADAAGADEADEAGGFIFDVHNAGRHGPMTRGGVGV